MAGNEAAFVYDGREEVPRTVVRVVVRSVDAIPARAFANCAKLRKVELPGGLRTIGEGAFFRCESFDGIQLPSSVSEIGDYAFYYCINLKSVNLPEGLRGIGHGAFRQCRSLETARVPSSVAAIGHSAFSGCSSLKSVLLSEGVQTIGLWAFNRCPSLKDIQVPSSVTKIGKRAFRNCTSLTSMLLHEGLREIGEGAFEGCSSLGNFRFHYLSARMAEMSFDPQTTVEVQSKVAQISALAKRGGEGWTAGRESLEQLRGLITYWELKEATTILELVLWKAKIEAEADGGEMEHTECNAKQRERDNLTKEDQDGGSNGTNERSRKECRVKCGADIIVKQVLLFFDGTYNRGWW